MQRSALRSAVCSALAALLLACSSGGSSPPAPPPPAEQGGWRDKVVYEVFVRSFADSSGDGIGDLQGLVAHLDDLNDGNPATTTDLGVDARWLMPIFPSPSYHGYDVTNYRSVNPQYGSVSDLDALVAAAHARGIKVILDFVPNHSASGHPWFQNARTGATSEKRDWYVWSATQPTGWTVPFGGGGTPWRLNSTDGTYFYAIFGSGMPDLNWKSAAVEAELLDTMKSWLARGVDGFRLDAVRYLVEDGPDAVQDTPETHAVLQRMRAALEAEYPGVLLVGEAWAPLETVATYWGAGDELQLAFSFDLADAVKQAATLGVATPVVNVLIRTETALAGKDRRFEAPFLSNHDQVRVMRQLGGDAAAARLVAATLFAMPGTPFVYYGEEIGMQGGASTGDEDKRTPMRWNATSPWFGFTTASISPPWYTAPAPELPGVDVATERADPGSLWNLYRGLIALRHALPGLSSADAVRPGLTGAGTGLLALVRGGAGQRVLFVANYATTAAGPFQVAVAGNPVVSQGEGLVGLPTASGGAIAFGGLGPRAFAFVSLD